MQDEDDGVGGLPAIALQIRVEHRHRGFFRAAFLQELPGREYCSVGIRKSSTDQLLKRNVRVMLLGKFTDLFCFGFRNFLCESFSQLFEELILAGHRQRIHSRPRLV